MTQPIEGTQPQEQPSGIPPQVEQAPQTAPAQPTVEQLQAELAAANQQREHFEKQYQALQPEYTRARQALASYVGAQAPQPQPPQDPLAPYVAQLTSQGYDEKSARAVAGVNYKMQQDLMQQHLAPLQQELQVTRNATDIDHAVTQATYLAPELFTSQADVDAARQAAMAHVQAGGRPDARLIVSVVNDNKFWQSRNNPPPQATPQNLPPLPVRQPFANGFNRVGGGFQPQPQTTTQSLSTESQRVADEIKNFLKK